MGRPTGSNLHVFQECTGFATIPDTREEIEAAEHGIARHTEIEEAIDDESFADDSGLPGWMMEIRDELEAKGVPLRGETEVTFVYDPDSGAHTCGSKLGRNYPRSKYGDKAVFGTADYLPSGWLLDWKFTNVAFDSIYAQLPPLQSHQLKFLASCFLAERSDTESINIGLVKVPDAGKPWLEYATWDVMAAHEYLNALKSRLSEEPSFNIGPHCGVCNKFRMCPARNGLLRSAVPGLMEINKDNAPAIVQRLVDVRKAIDIAEKQLQAYVEVTGEDIQLGDGYFYGKSKGSRRDICDPVKAVAMLSEVLGPDASSALLHTNPKMYIKELQAAAKVAGKDDRELMGWLEKSGIIKRNEYESIGIHRESRKKK